MDRKICLDSDIIIEYLKRNTEVKKKIDSLGEEFYITQINVFEIWSGRLPNEEKTIMDMFDSLSKVDFDESAALKAGHISSELRRTGNPLDIRDIFIASICITNNLELLTNNKKHFQRLKKFGLKLV